MTRAGAFARAFSPYRKKHFEHTESRGLLFPSWVAVDGYLTDARIEQAINGLALAYLCTVHPKALGVDIDDHAGKGQGYLLSMYDAVSRRFGARPSFTASSPRGLHCWYFLKSPFPFRFLEAQARERLEGLHGVELRPTPATGLRIPAEARLLSPDTLLPLHCKYDEAISEALEERAYHAGELFGAGIMPQALRASLRERKRRLAFGSVMKVEQDCFPILPGGTNEALNKLIPVYRSAGFTPTEAAGRFAGLIAPVYDGELRNWQRLHKRVSAYFKRSPEYYERPRRKEADLFAAPCGEAVAALWEAEKRKGRGLYHVEARRTGIKRLVSGIVNWQGFIHDVVSVPAEREAWGYLYPYFTKNTREGYVPLPKNMLFRLDKNYYRVIPFLEACGFLEAAPYSYVPGAGICRYYRVKAELFIGRDETQISKIS